MGLAKEVESIAEALHQQGTVLQELPALPLPTDDMTGKGEHKEFAVLQRQTQMENSMICQQQHTNMAGRIFGGFLMRRASEIAFATVPTPTPARSPTPTRTLAHQAYLHGGSNPRFKEFDKVSFKAPVNISDLLQFKAHVLRV